jgi:hypothetical protein
MASRREQEQGTTPPTKQGDGDPNKGEIPKKY